jgi:hypothetical protein
MKKLKRSLLVVAIVALASLPIGFVIAYRQVTQSISDMYAQWACAEMVIAHYDQYGRAPSNWEQMLPFYHPNSAHNGGLSVDQIRSRISIDFAMIDSLRMLYLDGSIPEVIQTVSGIQSHWAGAEPNKLVNQALTAKAPAQ